MDHEANHSASGPLGRSEVQEFAAIVQDFSSSISSLRETVKGLPGLLTDTVKECFKAARDATEDLSSERSSKSSKSTAQPTKASKQKKQRNRIAAWKELQEKMGPRLAALLVVSLWLG